MVKSLITSLLLQTKLYNYEPIYEELEGWDEDITTVRSYDELPATAKKYIEFISRPF